MQCADILGENESLSRVVCRNCCPDSCAGHSSRARLSPPRHLGRGAAATAQLQRLRLGDEDDPAALLAGPRIAIALPAPGVLEKACGPVCARRASRHASISPCWVSGNTSGRLPSPHPFGNHAAEIRTNLNSSDSQTSRSPLGCLCRSNQIRPPRLGDPSEGCGILWSSLLLLVHLPAVNSQSRQSIVPHPLRNVVKQSLQVR